MPKIEAYAAMVADRKKCRACAGLTNPADVDGGKHDSDHIGPWSRWQGNLDAKMMVVGQDWGDIKYLINNRGVEAPKNKTCTTLVGLLKRLGFTIGPPQDPFGQDIAFFTNVILCLKSEGGLQGKVRPQWSRECAQRFLGRQIEIIRPKIVVALGEHAFRGVLEVFGKPFKGPLRKYVEDIDGTVLPNGSRVFAVYHCGANGLRNRKLPVQQVDWDRMRPHM